MRRGFSKLRLFLFYHHSIGLHFSSETDRRLL
jgi:hypothetical protein